MSAETNKNVSRRFLEDVFGQGKLELVDQFFTANHTNDGPAALPGKPGPDGVRQLVSYYRKAFPDLRFTIDEQVAEGDTVITRWTAHGTHQGDMQGISIPVTGKPANVTGMTVDRFDSSGKIMASWGIFDQMGMLQQLGVMPMPGQGGQ